MYNCLPDVMVKNLSLSDIFIVCFLYRVNSLCVLGAAQKGAELQKVCRWNDLLCVVCLLIFQ